MYPKTIRQGVPCELAPATTTRL